MDDLVAAYGRLDDPARSWLRRHGVSTETMLSWPGPIGVAEIETHEPDIFSFADTGRLAYVHPIYSAGIYSAIIDIAGWLPADPARWWTCRRTGHPLGADCIDTAMIFDVPLLMFSTPWRWLRENGAGVCVLDWPSTRLDIAEVARGSGIIPEDLAHGIEIERRLDPPRPKLNILIPRAA